MTLAYKLTRIIVAPGDGDHELLVAFGNVYGQSITCLHQNPQISVVVLRVDLLQIPN